MSTYLRRVDSYYTTSYYYVLRCIGYRAKPKARDAANGRINSVHLTAILRLFGIPESEWVEDFAAG